MGVPIAQDEFQTVLDMYNLPGTLHVVPRSKRQDLLPQIW